MHFLTMSRLPIEPRCAQLVPRTRDCPTDPSAPYAALDLLFRLWALEDLNL
jgi:hypothetical protein